MSDLTPNENAPSEIAAACLVYSLVPYLGILFIPLALVSATLGYAASIRRPHVGGRRTAKRCIWLALLLTALQLVLWKLFYLLPST